MKFAGGLGIRFTSPVDEDLLSRSQLVGWKEGFGGRFLEQRVIIFANLVGDDLLSAECAFGEVRCNVWNVDSVKNGVVVWGIHRGDDAGISTAKRCENKVIWGSSTECMARQGVDCVDDEAKE